MMNLPSTVPWAASCPGNNGLACLMTGYRLTSDKASIAAVGDSGL